MKTKSSGIKVLKILLIVLCSLILIVGAYIAYVFISFDRLDDNLPLETENNMQKEAVPGEKYTIMSYNIGFCAYTDDFGFFMDGGTESRARSAETVKYVLSKISAIINYHNPDIAVIEEIDTDATRSHHVNEYALLNESMVDYSRVFAQNYDSPYLFYPILCPIGASVSGIATYSVFNITSSLRRSLPVEDSVMKIVDLDRCYSATRIPAGDKELIVYSVHLSAYTSDGSISLRQLELLTEDMQSEYDKGNYVIAAGDFNKDLLGEGPIIFNVSDSNYSWAQPLPDGFFDDYNLTLVAPYDDVLKIPSCRNADGPNMPDQYVITPDGFIVSDNITVVSSEVVDTGFAYSDHNPVIMEFILNN